METAIKRKSPTVTFTAALYRITALVGFAAVFATGDPVIAGGILALAMVFFSIHQLALSKRMSNSAEYLNPLEQTADSYKTEYRRLHRDLHRSHSNEEDHSTATDSDNIKKQAA